MPKVHKDKILGVVGLAVSVFFTAQTSMLPVSKVVGDPGPKLFPYIACFLIGICSLILLVKKGGEQTQYLTKSEWKRAFVLYGVYVAYFLLLWLVGYKIAIPLVTFVISWLFSRGENTKVWKTIVYSVGVSAAIFVIYVLLLESVLPAGILG